MVWSLGQCNDIDIMMEFVIVPTVIVMIYVITVTNITGLEGWHASPRLSKLTHGCSGMHLASYAVNGVMVRPKECLLHHYTTLYVM